MKINQTDKIDSSLGDFILMTDYGIEGFAISGQYATLQEAFEDMGICDGPQIIFQICDTKDFD